MLFIVEYLDVKGIIYLEFITSAIQLHVHNVAAMQLTAVLFHVMQTDGRHIIGVIYSCRYRTMVQTVRRHSGRQRLAT